MKPTDPSAPTPGAHLAGIEPDAVSGKVAPHGRFHAAGVSRASLTPGLASQSLHSSTQRIPAPGGALRRPDHERRPITAAGRHRRDSTLQVRPSRVLGKHPQDPAVLLRELL